jgi:hypothetical protein
MPCQLFLHLALKKSILWHIFCLKLQRYIEGFSSFKTTLVVTRVDKIKQPENQLFVL